MHRLSPVDDNRRAVDVGRRVGRQKGDNVGNLFALGKTAQQRKLFDDAAVDHAGIDIVLNPG